jgi:tetratricopeptide (TPR) repeat protein
MRALNHQMTLAALGCITLITAGGARPEAAPGDACSAAVQAEAVDAERVCSDHLAGLRYDGAAGIPQQMALASTLNNRAMARMGTRDLEGAAADFEEALALRPDAWAIHLNHGNFLLMRAEPGAALEAYDRVAALAPRDSAARNAARKNSALAWRVLGNPAAAERALAESNADDSGGAALNPERQPRGEPAPPRP